MQSAPRIQIISPRWSSMSNSQRRCGIVDLIRAAVMTEASAPDERESRMLRWRMLLGEASADQANTP